MHQATSYRHRRGFTLVELIIVVSIIGILAAIVVPRFASGKAEATEAALATNVRAVRVQISQYLADHGEYPDNISGDWFVGGELPEHPDNSFGVPYVQRNTNRKLQHPTSKVLKKGVKGAYWYNYRTGQFHARVVDQGSAEATLASYNRVNQSAETSLGNY